MEAIKRAAMEQVNLHTTLGSKIKAYLQLIKPGIILGNAVTAAGGFGLASRGELDVGRLGLTLLGLGCVIGSACAFNNVIDKEADQQMARTQQRPLATGAITPKSALIFAIILGFTGVLLLDTLVNLSATLLAVIGFAVYVFFYSFLKYRTVHATLIGSIAGAIPPVVGYCAVHPRLDGAALLLFLIVALWQMPHFYAIAIYRLQEYAAAAIPVLPLVKGMRRTKREMWLYVAGFSAVSALLSWGGYAGRGYLAASLCLGVAWLCLGWAGFKTDDDSAWGRWMFRFSLVAITLLCALMFFS
jgi:protoheme IX farnesyltransferase